MKWKIIRKCLIVLALVVIYLQSIGIAYLYTKSLATEERMKLLEEQRVLAGQLVAISARVAAANDMMSGQAQATLTRLLKQLGLAPIREFMSLDAKTSEVDMMSSNKDLDLGAVGGVDAVCVEGSSVPSK